MIKINQEKVARIEQLRANQEARVYLAETDWYVVRQQETGETIPAKVSKARAEARAKVVEVPNE